MIIVLLSSLIGLLLVFIYMINAKLNSVQYLFEKEIRRNKDDIKDVVTISNENMAHRFSDNALAQKHQLDHTTPPKNHLD